MNVITLKSLLHLNQTLRVSCNHVNFCRLISWTWRNNQTANSSDKLKAPAWIHTQAEPDYWLVQLVVMLSLRWLHVNGRLLRRDILTKLVMVLMMTTDTRWRTSTSRTEIVFTLFLPFLYPFFTLFLPFFYPFFTLFLPFFYPVCTPRFPHSIQSRMFHNIMV